MLTIAPKNPRYFQNQLSIKKIILCLKKNNFSYLFQEIGKKIFRKMIRTPLKETKQFQEEIESGTLQRLKPPKEK